MAKIANYRDWITNNIPDYDSDMDWMPDWWESLHGGSSTSLVAEVDVDGDNFSNLDEWIADTDPTDGNSYLKVLAYTNANEVVFASSTNRQYQIDYRSNLADTNETWQVETGWFTPASTQTVTSVSTSASNRFYRVGVKLD